MEGNLWAAYVRRLMGDEQGADLARRISAGAPAISRWRNGLVPNSANVADLARAYGHNPLEAFVAAGMLDESEAGRGLKAVERRFLADVREQMRLVGVAETEVRQVPVRHSAEA